MDSSYVYEVFRVRFRFSAISQVGGASFTPAKRGASRQPYQTKVGQRRRFTVRNSLD